MRAHFALVYLPWALGYWAIALPGLLLGLLLERLPRPRRSYLGDWPADYDVFELAQVVDRHGYAVRQAKGLEALRSMSFS